MCHHNEIINNCYRPQHILLRKVMRMNFVMKTFCLSTTFV